MIRISLYFAGFLFMASACEKTAPHAVAPSLAEARAPAPASESGSASPSVAPRAPTGAVSSEPSAAVESVSAPATKSLFPSGVTKPRVMIVGDSISAGPGCYKKYLLRELTSHQYRSFEFVGEYEDRCGGEVRHSAVSCATAEQYTHENFSMPNCFLGQTFAGMSTLMAAHHPDLVMLQLGVNDLWIHRSVNSILRNYDRLVAQARNQNPRVVLVVAQIQKIRPNCGTDESVTKLADSLVHALPAWAEKRSTESSPVLTADLWTNSDWSKAETRDCVHPNEVGAEKMGKNWFEALKHVLPHEPSAQASPP